MRTTLTLDDDLAATLREIAHRRRVPFRQVVNDLIRRGLKGGRGGRRGPEPFVVDTFRSGFRAGVDPLRLNQLVDQLATEQAIDELRR